MNRERAKRQLGDQFLIGQFDIQPVKGSTSNGRSYGTIGQRTAGADARAERIREAYRLAQTNQVPLFGGGQLGRLAREIQELLKVQREEAEVTTQAANEVAVNV